MGARPWLLAYIVDGRIVRVCRRFLRISFLSGRLQPAGELTGQGA